LGRKIIEETKNLLQSQHFSNRYITMSPKTEMAIKFHLKNGAILLQENPTTNNFEYES
jgi:precorrin-6x reductase